MWARPDTFTCDKAGRVDRLSYAYGDGPVPTDLDGGRQTFWYHLDGLGSTIAMTDESGKIRNRYGYDQYGNPLAPDRDACIF